MSKSIKQLQSHLLLLTPFDVFRKLVNVEEMRQESHGEMQELVDAVELVLKGFSSKVFDLPVYRDHVAAGQAKEQILAVYSECGDVKKAVRRFAETMAKNAFLLGKSPEVVEGLLLVYAVALGQCFVQLNYTGPALGGFDALEMFFGALSTGNDKLDRDVISALEVQGLGAYELAEQPVLLVVCLGMMEHLVGMESVLEGSSSSSSSLEQLVTQHEVLVTRVLSGLASLCAALWWKSRYLQVQMSLFREVSSTISSASAVLHDARVVERLDYGDVDVSKQLSVTFYLEKARNALHAETEHLVAPALHRAQQISGMQLVLTGAKAKRTKYQEKATASLVVLAKSASETLFTDSQTAHDRLVENKQLDSDLLLETPVYESFDSDLLQAQASELKQSHDSALLSTDQWESSDSSITSAQPEAPQSPDDKKRLVPVAIRSENIPASLQGLDPNAQPRLNDLDSIQIFLRLKTVRQTSPQGSHLVEEELMALVERIIANNSANVRRLFPPVNWLVYAKALWERSVIEATRAKTVERGVFQMQALVEELNTQIQNRLFAEPTADAACPGSCMQDDACSGNDLQSAATRMRYINVLPLTARWALDASLADKFMALGVLKSAVEIYERLCMVPEMAVCYASVGQTAQAEQLLRQRLLKVPNDARCISILGDITKDPSLWERAWQLAKYQNAKVSLSKYYYSLKQQDSANIDVAIRHMHDALSLNPLNFNNWYFYGCLGLESGQYELAAEAFTRCVSIDDTHTHSWSNLGGALLHMDLPKEALQAFQNAVKSSDASNWRIWENFLIAASKVGDWIQVLRACRTLLELKPDDSVINIRIVEALVAQLTAEPYPLQSKLSFFQKSCLDYLCSQLPKVNTRSSQLWRIQAKVELWRNKPWNSLSCMEKAFRVDLNHENLISSEKCWNEAVETCTELVSSYENLGDLPGKHGAGDLVCKDWKFKARSSIRTLMGKGKISWQDSDGWERLLETKNAL